jgi:hypothetical protein
MSNFSKTKNISAFANSNNIVEIKTLPGKDKGVFFAVLTTVDGEEIIARVGKSYKGKINAQANVSWFTPEDGEASWMIHEAGERPEAITTLSFKPTATTKKVAVVDLDEAL